MKTYTVNNGEGFVYNIIIDKPLTKVTIHSGEFNLSATGNARWYETDTWSEKVGVSLAEMRAIKRLASKIEKRIVSQAK